MASHGFDLKPDRGLLNPNFDGYKLSLDPLPVYKVGLEDDVDVVSLRDDQYSYQHVKAFGLQNYLFADQWNPQLVFYIDTRWQVMRFTANEGTMMEKPRAVFQIPESSELRHTIDRHNVTIHFTSRDFVSLSDGTGQLYLIQTGSREQDQTWKVVYKGSPARSHTDDSAPQPFILLHSVLHTDGNGAPHVECLLLHVEKNAEADTDNEVPTFLTYITWASLLSVDGDKWELERTRQFSGASSPDFAVVEPEGEGVIFASQKTVQLVYDSLKPIEKKQPEEELNGVKENDNCSYVWSQTDEDLTLFFNLPPEVTKPDIDCVLTSETVKLCIKNSDLLLEGTLSSTIDVEGSAWTLEKEQGQNKLELHLAKSEAGVWTEVTSGDQRGHLVADLEQVEEIHRRLAYNTSEELNPEPDRDSRAYNAQELEECDDFPEECSSLIRFDGDSHQLTHQVNLHSHQWLFNIQTEAQGAPCICLRHDVDGLVWQHAAGDPWKHISTFNAFGYVQASKQQKKFTTCSPDFSYVVICDCVRHIYLYRQHSQIATPLRNRKTGREVSAVAKQQLVSLDSTENITGVYASNDRLFLLVGKTLVMVQVNIAQ